MMRRWTSRLFGIMRGRLRYVGIACAALLVLWLATLVYHLSKPLPDGVSVEGPVHAADVEFLFDLSYQRDGAEVVDQRIFDRVLAMIDSAERFIVIDMFLFNDEHTGNRSYRPLSEEITSRLVARKAADPLLDIAFITDPINNFYGAYTARNLERLEEAGVAVIPTRLTRLRDSNWLYSAGWRVFAQWFGTGGPGFLPHPLTSRGQRVTARSYLALFNFKANHRKLLVTDRSCLVTSANPHDASSFHSNIAFAATGSICQDILDGERGVAAFSGTALAAHGVNQTSDSIAPTTVQYLTEGRIRAALLQEIDSVQRGDRIDIAVFYMSERSIVEALIAAAIRGAEVRVLLDPNKDAFGREKGGIPNRQVGWELRERSDGRIGVRWYDTHGEQFHTKLAIFARADSRTVIGGSANFTRRNIADLNLEADLRVRATADAPFAREVDAYFERLWSNRDGHYTLEFDAYRDDAWLKRVLYRIQEFTGLSTY